MADTMGADVLKNNLTNPARTYMWELVIPAPVGGGDSGVLTARCQSAEIPGVSFGEILVSFKQTAGIKYPGKIKYDHKFTCTFIEGEDHAVFDALHAWQQKVVHNFTGVGAGDDLIKQDIFLNMQMTKGDSYMKIKLVGAYIEVVDKVSMKYESEDEVIYSATFSFDRWEQVA